MGQWAGALEWAYLRKERMDTDGLLYIRVITKSEQIAKYRKTKVLEPSCLTLPCDGHYKDGSAYSGSSRGSPSGALKKY